ncbi:MAG TPA: hypothetical protein VGH31_05325, partial [Acidimicrobiales bacterium]
MCGVVGLLIRDPELEAELGRLLGPMITALDERGPDSSGIAVYADHQSTSIQVSLGSDDVVDWPAFVESLAASSLGSNPDPFGAGMVVEVEPALEASFKGFLLATWPQIRVLGTGSTLRVLKDTGRPHETCTRYGIDQWQGYMAVAHTR